MSEDEKTGMISRWSKRKLESKREANVEETYPSQTQDATQSEHDALLQANREEAESIDLSTIDKDSDLSIFMKEGVPALLKRQALSKLWKSNPIFANVDGLNDYDENFGDESLIMKTFKSAYKAGGGYAKKLVEDSNVETEEPTETKILEKSAKPPTEKIEIDRDIEFADENLEQANSEGISQKSEDEKPMEASPQSDEEQVELKKISLRQRLALND